MAEQPKKVILANNAILVATGIFIVIFVIIALIHISGRVRVAENNLKAARSSK